MLKRTHVRESGEEEESNPDLMITRTGVPDMRVKAARHDPALVVQQQLEEQANRLFQEMGAEDIEARGEEESLGEEYPNGLEGQTTGRPDMRLRPMRHDPKLVAMQQVVDRIRELRTQIAINKGYVEGDPAALPSLRELFDVEFLDAGDLSGLMAERVPDYEVLRQAHLKYGKSPVEETEEHPHAVRRSRPLSAPPPVEASSPTEPEPPRPPAPEAPRRGGSLRRLSSGVRRAA